MTLLVEAPTDAQLRYIAALCDSQGWEPPAVVASKQEASAIIDSMRNSTYSARRYDYPFSRDAVDWIEPNAETETGAPSR